MGTHTQTHTQRPPTFFQDKSRTWSPSPSARSPSKHRRSAARITSRLNIRAAGFSGLFVRLSLTDVSHAKTRWDIKTTKEGKPAQTGCAAPKHQNHTFYVFMTFFRHESVKYLNWTEAEMMKFICLQLYRSVDLITLLIIFDVDFSFANNTEHNYPQFTLFELKQRGRSDLRLSSVWSRVVITRVWVVTLCMSVPSFLFVWPSFCCLMFKCLCL